MPTPTSVLARAATRPDARPDALEPTTARDLALAPKSILIVSYHFPPDSRVGAVRPAKFAKYLTRYGWRPMVLTIDTKHIPSPEVERAEEVKSVPTTRTSVWPTALDVLVTLRNRLRSFVRPRQSAAIHAQPAPVASPHVDRPARLLFVRKLGQLLFEFPDSQVGWVIPAVWTGYWLIRRERIRLILVTSPPRSSVFIGVILARLTGARLITDLRDPWRPRDEGPSEATLSRTDRIRAWFERKLMERSDEIITTADLYTECLRQSHPSVAPHKFHTITNGYDSEDLSALEEIKPNERFTLSYLGTFYWTRTPRPLLIALSELVEADKLPRHLLQVNFIGTFASSTGETMDDLVRLCRLEGCVSVRGVVPYQQALREMRKSDVLILLAPKEQYYGIPAKSFEYIATGKPILCLGSTGATANLIARSGCGVVVDSHTVEEIKTAILTLFESWRSGEPMARDFDISAFERQKLTRDLIALIEKPS
jgi:glycosyltransferase involved in cell wall biosynthesis